MNNAVKVPGNASSEDNGDQNDCRSSHYCVYTYLKVHFLPFNCQRAAVVSCCVCKVSQLNIARPNGAIYSFGPLPGIMQP